MVRAADRRFAAVSVCMQMLVLAGVPVRAAEQTASEERRVALVIGNAAYEEPPARLVNPVGDATAMASVLRDLDFAVTLVTDANMEQMARATNTFIGQVRSGDVAVFYYAGHGLELEDGLNYLAPVDFSSDYDAVQAKYRSLHAGEVQERMERAGARTRIVILDACRNNPFERSRTLTRGGLGQMGPRGGLVAFATEAGDVASDDGLYTRHLVEALREPGVQAMELFTRVSEAVEAASGGQQIPAVNFAGAAGRFVFRRGVAVRTADPAPTYAASDVFRDCPSCPEMVVIPAGTFQMVSSLRLSAALPRRRGRRAGDGRPPGSERAGRRPPGSERAGRRPPGLERAGRRPRGSERAGRRPPGSERAGRRPPGSEEDRYDNEGSRHRVTLRSFAMGVKEVTFDEWDACVRGGGCDGYRPDDEGWGRGARPVINVSWEDAQAYVSWLSEITGAQYRLPSESEWEYAARAGTTTPYHTGSTISTDQANYRYSRGRTTPVGTFAPNAFGLYDVHGNVWERVEDCWHDDYRGAPSDGTAWTRGGDCGRRVLRGGSWDGDPRSVRSASRSRNATGYRNGNAGFRVSRTLD